MFPVSPELVVDLELYLGRKDKNVSKNTTYLHINKKKNFRVKLCIINLL